MCIDGHARDSFTVTFTPTTIQNLGIEFLRDSNNCLNGINITIIRPIGKTVNTIALYYMCYRK